jgi:hypothetical protein
MIYVIPINLLFVELNLNFDGLKNEHYEKNFHPITRCNFCSNIL